MKNKYINVVLQALMRRFLFKITYSLYEKERNLNLYLPGVPLGAVPEVGGATTVLHHGQGQGEHILHVRHL
jgi:hypothetical protein